VAYFSIAVTGLLFDDRQQVRTLVVSNPSVTSEALRILLRERSASAGGGPSSKSWC